MRDLKNIAKHISSLCPGKWHQHYTQSKILSDPLYEGVFHELEKSTQPLLDIGCGLGILGLYLRERGLDSSIVGFDYDDAKINEGRELITNGKYTDIELVQGDARIDLPDHSGDVTMLDMLQFFDLKQQEILLSNAAQKVRLGGKLIIRSGLHEKKFRFYLTWIADVLNKCTFWMKSAPKNYPTAAFLKTLLANEGFQVEIKPFWGNTPFNNYLIVAIRSED